MQTVVLIGKYSASDFCQGALFMYIVIFLPAFGFFVSRKVSVLKLQAFRIVAQRVLQA